MLLTKHNPIVHTDYCYDFLKTGTDALANKDYFSKEQLGGKWYHDCYGLPYRYSETNGVPDNAGGLEHDGRIVKNTSISGWAVGYQYDKDKAIEVKEKVIFLGFVCDYCWGHLITDSMTHLWWFLTNEYKEKYSEYDVYYWSQKPLKGIFFELITAIIPPQKIHHIDKVLHFESAYVPDDCLFRTDKDTLKYTSEYVDLIDWYVSSHTSSNTFDKLYYIRANDSRQYTSKDVHSILKKNGFTFVNPIEYSLAEQISIFNKAKEIVIEESSASHNLIFCKPGTKVTILRKCSYINEYQAFINQMRHLDIQYVDCHLSAFSSNILETTGPFFIYANDLFCNRFSEQRKLFPFKEFRNYLRRHLYFEINPKDYLDIIQWKEFNLLQFARELQYAKDYYRNKLSWILSIPSISYSMKKRIQTYIIKRIIRNLM